MTRNATVLRPLIVLTFSLLIPAASAQAPQPHADSAKPRLAEEAFKNIQVLKGIPEEQLIPSMQFIANALGVECDFCHMTGAFDKDDKQTKQTARKMMQMVLAINAGNFDGRREVTCFSCHRGAPRPIGTPIVPEEEIKPLFEEPPAPDSAKLPAPDVLLAAYLKALGGVAATQGVSTRIETGKVSMFGRQVPIEVFSKAPDKRVSIMHTPGGDSITAFDSQIGWLGSSGRPIREMHAGDLQSARMDATFQFPSEIKGWFSELRSGAPEKISGQDTYQLIGTKEGQPPVHLYFDQQSGLLVRLVRYIESPMGLNPTQIDYADYRDVDGVKTPFRWTIARPLGRFTVQLEQVRQNVTVDDSKFARPPAPAAETKPPSH